MYLKITNSTETHHGLQYHDGLNIDPLPFAKEGSCCPGGIYFTTPEYICYFLGMGIYIREVTIPEDAEMIQDPDEGDKWRASKVILGPRKCLGDVDTWKWLVENTNANVHGALRYASYNGHIEVVKYLIESGSDIHDEDDCACRVAAHNGQLEVVKCLVENGANIHAFDDYALKYSAAWGHLEIVKYLVENGADIHANDDGAFRRAAMNGYLEIVKYLLEHGADIHVWNDEMLRCACNEHTEVIQFLKDKGCV